MIDHVWTFSSFLEHGLVALASMRHRMPLYTVMGKLAGQQFRDGDGNGNGHEGVQRIEEPKYRSLCAS